MNKYDIPTDMNRYGAEKLPVPYLENKPEVIDINIGRQLFVDDYLISSTNLVRCWHKPKKSDKNPVFYPETELEKGTKTGHAAMAAPFSDGVWYDGYENKFKMWYHAGWFDGTAYAESEDGFIWKRIDRVIPEREGVMRDSAAVVVDNYNNPDEKYKMFLYSRPVEGEVYSSKDGVEWKLINSFKLGGDRSTMFYNPFRKKWVYSIRSYWGGRSRSYLECDSLDESASEENSVPWMRADKYDITDDEIGYPVSLYNLDCVAYESVLLGAFCIFTGPENDVCTKSGLPKMTNLQMGFSRDGFHFQRPDDRTPFIDGSHDKNQWDCGYIHSNNGIVIIDGDELRFYYTGFKGDESKTSLEPQYDGMYSNASMGIATLRRDGFCSMNAYGYEGELITEKMKFDGEYLFINADSRYGSIKIALIDEECNEIPGYTAQEFNDVKQNGTKILCSWENNTTIKIKENVRFKFTVKDGALYSFWVSKKSTGESGGYLGAGEIGKKTYIDEEN